MPHCTAETSDERFQALLAHLWMLNDGKLDGRANLVAIGPAVALNGMGRSHPARRAATKQPARSKAAPSRLGRGHAAERIPEILEAATAEFIEQGFVGASMDNIAARVRVSKPIIYRHFRSKHALLEAVLFRELTSRFVEVREQMANYDGPLKPLIEAVLTRANSDPNASPEALPIFRLILSDGYRVPQFARSLYENGFRPVNEAMRAQFRRAMAGGRMRKANPEFAARELFAPFFHSVMMMTLMGPGQFDIWQSRAYLDHALKSFCQSYEIAE